MSLRTGDFDLDLSVLLETNKAICGSKECDILYFYGQLNEQSSIEMSTDPCRHISKSNYYYTTLRMAIISIYDVTVVDYAQYCI